MMPTHMKSRFHSPRLRRLSQPDVSRGVMLMMQRIPTRYLRVLVYR
jgi:hypothetical protein